MKARRRKRLTSRPKSGLTRRVTTTVPMKSQRTASMPRCMPSASRAGRTTISAVSTQKKNTPATSVGASSSRRMFEKPCSKKLCRLAVLRDELQRHAVVAPALVGGRRAVVEEVPVVAAAADAVVLGARVDQEKVLLGPEDPGDAGEEGGPAGAGLEFHLGGEERQAAAGAGEDAGAFLGI